MSVFPRAPIASRSAAEAEKVDPRWPAGSSVVVNLVDFNRVVSALTRSRRVRARC